MKNSKPDDRLLLVGLVVAGLAVCTFAACNRRTLIAGAVKAPPDARAPDGANETAAPPDGTNADARDPGYDASPDGQSLAQPCGQATCLVDLFRTCVPEGDCAARLGSTAFYDICYANGVTAAFSHGGYESTTTVRRDGVLCYSIKDSTPQNAGATSYVVTDGSGNEIATGVRAERSTTITVTCSGGEPSVVSRACLESPVDQSTCTSGGCPFGSSVDAGRTGGTTGGTGGSSGGAGGSTSAGGTTGGTGGSSGGAGGSTSTGTAAGLRCTLPRGPDAEPGMTCKTYCDDLTVMCKSSAGVPATAAECVDNCMANFSEVQLCCRSAHLMNGTGSTACEDALGRGACL